MTTKNKLWIAILALVMVCIPFSAFAQNSGIMLSGAYSNSLFPEFNYEEEPVLMETVDGEYIITDGLVSTNYSEVKNIRLDDSVGAFEGFKLVRDLDLDYRIGFDFIFPKKASNGKANKSGTHLIGFDVKGNFGRNIVTWNYYDSPSQYSEQDTLSTPVSANLVWAQSFVNKDNFNGLKFNYNFDFVPHYYSKMVDTSQSPVLIYYPSYGNDADVFKNNLAVKYDSNIKVGNIKFLLGTEYNFGIQNRINYKAVDTNDDGRDDVIYTLSEYANLKDPTDSSKPASYGIASEYPDLATVSSFNALDLGFIHKAKLDMLINFSVSDKLDVLLDADYLFSYDNRETYARLNYKDTSDVSQEDSKSFTSERYMTDFGNAVGTLVFRIKTENDKPDYRIGFGYGRSSVELYLDGKNRDGSNIYSTQNPGHFPEFALGSDDFAAGTLIKTGISPSVTTTHVAHVETGLEWKASSKINFLASIGVNFGYQVLYYRAFNTDTRTVWQETRGNEELIWNLVPTLGLSLPFGKDGTISFVIDNANNSDSSWKNTFQTAPYNLTKSKQGDNGANDIIDTNVVNLSYSWRLVFKK